MINLKCNLRNPWWKDEFLPQISHWGVAPWPNMCWELEVHKTSDIIDLDLAITWRQSHAGVYLSLGLLGHAVSFSVYDCRHWDSDLGTWQDF
jgi:hypothetical protein